MKTAYELAMERLKKSSPDVKVTAGQKKELAELDSQYAAKVAAREIHIQSELAKATSKGDYDTIQRIQEEWVHERKSLQAELDEKKEKVRATQE